jgi:hypothetical protein
MSDEGRVQATPEALRLEANQAELVGNWALKALLEATADRLLQLDAQNQAYRHALQSGVSINMVAKRHWFNRTR